MNKKRHQTNKNKRHKNATNNAYTLADDRLSIITLPAGKQSTNDKQEKSSYTHNAH